MDYQPCLSHYESWYWARELYKELRAEAVQALDDHTAALETALDKCIELEFGSGGWKVKISGSCPVRLIRVWSTFRESRRRWREAASARDEAHQRADELWKCIDNHAIAAGQVEYPVDLEPLPDEPDEPDLDEW